MGTIVNQWPQWFRDRYGGEWPQNYVAIDVETTGFERAKDVITEWGHCLVQDGKVVDRLQVIFDWTNHPIVQDEWIRARLNKLRQGMEMSGRISQISYSRMKEEGVRPEKALAFIADFTRELQAKKTLFVLHGGLFDEEMLDNLLDDGFSFGDDGWIDTECLEKATQLPLDPRVQPQRDDTLRTYFKRVKHARLKIGERHLKSSLDEFCFAKYDFVNRFGIRRDELHEAYVDAYATHLIMEEHRPLIRPASEAVFVPPPVPARTKSMPTPAPTRQVTRAPGPIRYRKQRNN